MSKASPTDDGDDYDDYEFDDYYDEPTTEINGNGEIITDNIYGDATEATQMNAIGDEVKDVEYSSVASVNDEEKTESLFRVLIAESGS